MTDRDDWHEWRRGGVGGSDIAGIIGLSRYASPWSVWASKVGLLPPSEPTTRQRVGQLLEPAIATLFHEATGLFVTGEQTWCQHPNYEWARCTVDGFVTEADFLDAEVFGTHEIKTDARYGWDEVPDSIRAQCVWQLGVTHLEHCWLSVLHGGFTYRLYEIDWDADAVVDWHFMLDRAGELWEHVLSGEPPPVDGSDATAAALAQVYPDHQPGEIVALDDLAEKVRLRGEWKAHVKYAEKQVKNLENAIKAAMGDAEVGTVDGEPVLTYRTSERKGYTVQPSTVRTLRAATKKDKEAVWQAS